MNIEYRTLIYFEFGLGAFATLEPYPYNTRNECLRHSVEILKSETYARAILGYGACEQ